MSEGIVSGLRDIDEATFIQNTAAMSPGSSGGGLFNADGKLVGIVTSYFSDSQNLNFALPADLIVDAKIQMEFARTKH